MSARLTLSWSRLRDYELCHHMVRKKMDGADREAIKDGRVYLAGTVCDRIQRRLLEHDDPQPGMMLDWLDEVLDHHAHHSDEYVIKWKGGKTQDYQRIRAKCVRVLTELEPILFEKIIPLGYQAEVKFRQTIGVTDLEGQTVPVDLIGGMDILTKAEDGTYGVHDLKATENDSYVSTTLGQLIFYSIAVRSMFGEYPTRLSFLTPACKEKEVPVYLSRDDIRVMLTRIEKYCHGVWSKDWTPRDQQDGVCMYECSVRHACDMFRLHPAGRVSFEELAARRRTLRGGRAGSGGAPAEGAAGAGGDSAA